MGINVKSILRGAATIAAPLVSATPWGAAALAAVNAFLPDDDKLPESATGQQVLDKVEALPAEQQAAILGQLIQLEMRESDNFAANVRSMADVDMAGASTRPTIALMMAWLVVAIGASLCLALCLATYTGDAEVKALGELWPLVLALMGTPTALLRAYFGLRSNDKRSRYAAATGQPIPELGGVSVALRRLMSG